jgi:hypothetical protein
MTTQITITLSDELYAQAEQFARLANRDIASILLNAINSSIPPMSTQAASLEPISSLSDEKVLALTELQMEPEEDIYVSQLLDKQQAGKLTGSERYELQTLMQTYQEGLLRKATALSEAVRRGLVEPLGE